MEQSNNNNAPQQADKEKVEFPREKFSRLMAQRFFLSPSFEIYNNGVAGLFDLGPPGTAIKSNILSLWRNHFVLQENMLEVDCTSITPAEVLTVSGHTAKFTDLLVRDEKEPTLCFRADHLLEAHLETLLAVKDIKPEYVDELKTILAQVDTYGPKEMDQLIKKYGAKSPETGNGLTFPEPFNLMFATQIGPTGQLPGFLRPETAQGIFVNFKRLLEFNGGKIPFAGAQIGQAFRNEIAPRSGLLRVREFTLAEIEHFLDPNNKSHPKFKLIEDYEIIIFPNTLQTTTKKTVTTTVGKAVREKIINNETLGYFIARTHMFLVKCGIKPDRLRFRQHLQDEMAHYAADCWDAEIQSSYGWVECVGIADRSCYDLSQHAEHTKAPLVAFVDFPNKEIREIPTAEIVTDKGKIAAKYKTKVGGISKYLSELGLDAVTQFEADLAKGPVAITVENEKVEITKEMVKSVKRGTKRVAGENITPGVIEPSFGIGRILYSVLEHSFSTRPGSDQRHVLALPPAIAPLKVSVLPLMQKDDLLALLPPIIATLNEWNLSHKVDETGQSIGRRYARTDEIGIPFGITIDYDTRDFKTVTLRERDSTHQVRIPIDEVAHVIHRLIQGNLKWEDVQAKYPKVAAAEE